MTTLRLAHGFLLRLYRDKTALHHLNCGDVCDLSGTMLEFFESACLGVEAGDVADAQTWLQNGWLEAGEPEVDGVILEHLKRLDCEASPGLSFALTDQAVQATYSALLDAHALRKRFYAELGQLSVLPETALRRVLEIQRQADNRSLRLVCLGDDDLLCIGLAKLGHQVTVFDADAYLLSVIQRAAGLAGCVIETRLADFRDPLDAADLGRFDAFVTDPMPTRGCYDLFLSRAGALLKASGTGFVAVAPAAKPLFAASLQASGWVEVAAYRRFNRYYSYSLQRHAYESDFVRVQLSEKNQLVYAPCDYAVPADLYKERLFGRPRIFMMSVESIENIQQGYATHLDLLLDYLAAEQGCDLQRRHHARSEYVCSVTCWFDDGYLTLYLNRRVHFISIVMLPHRPSLANALLQLVLRAYKPRVAASSAMLAPSAWVLRFA